MMRVFQSKMQVQSLPGGMLDMMEVKTIVKFRESKISKFMEFLSSGDKPVTGFSTVYAEYYLMSPSDLYKPIMTETDEKVGTI